MTEEKISWTVTETAPTRKTYNWYWAVGIIAIGISAGGVIAQNYLFAVLIILGAFALMLAGSRGGARYQFSISERGARVGQEFIPMEKIKRFSILEDDTPMVLVLDTQGMMGMTSVPIAENVDYRSVRTLLKNKNIEEVENMRSSVESISRALGL